MSVALTIAGVTYVYPTTSDDTWGDSASNWAVAVSTQLLQRTGGNFILTNDVNFGGSFGLVSVYYKSRTSNIASSGVVRLAVSDTIAFRNNANSGNIALGVDGSDNFTINGTPVLLSPGGVLSVADGGTGLSSYTIGDLIYASATTTFAKLNIGTSGYLLTSSGSAPQWSQYLSKAHGGTNADNSSVTFPSSGVIVTEAGTETLTNKTLTSPTITSPTITSPTINGATIATSTLTTPQVNGIKNAVKSSQTTGFTLAATDYYVPCDATSAGFTVTLPAGVTGTTYVIEKTDSTFNVVTIGSLTTLNTQGETVTIIYDGSNWQVVGRRIPSQWASYSPGSQGFGNLGSSDFYWMRVGNSLQMRGNWTTGTTSGSEAQMNLPTGLTSGANISNPTVVGNTLAAVATAAPPQVLIEPSKTYFTFSIQDGSRAGLSKVAGNAGFANTTGYSMVTHSVSITGWNG
jgi:hypothetical protein